MCPQSRYFLVNPISKDLFSNMDLQNVAYIFLWHSALSLWPSAMAIRFSPFYLHPENIKNLKLFFLKENFFKHKSHLFSSMDLQNLAYTFLWHSALSLQPSAMAIRFFPFCLHPENIKNLKLFSLKANFIKHKSDFFSFPNFCFILIRQIFSKGKKQQLQNLIILT